MIWETFLDLKSAAARLDGSGWQEVEIPEDLAGNIKLITDYQDARFGVEQISGQITAYAPIIEKQLRDEGVIDDLAEVIVHSASRHGDTARVFYTVVPNDVMLKYRDWARQHKDLLFVYPLAAVLLNIALKSGLKDGALLFAHGKQVAILALRAGQVVAADSLQYAGTLETESGRIAQRAWSMCLENPSSNKAVSFRFLVLRHGGSTAAEAATLCDAIEDRANSFPGVADVSLTRDAELSTLLADLPASIGQVSALDRLLYFCSRAVPWLAAIMVVHLLVSAASGLHWYSQRNALQKQLNEQMQNQSGGIPEQLAVVVKDAERLDPELQRIKKMLDAREHARLIPALPVLLSDIRAAAMDKVKVTMVGAVSGAEGGLISITFNGDSLENSFESERSFIHELESRGYKVVKREVDSTSTTGSMFKLSIIRSR